VTKPVLIPLLFSVYWSYPESHPVFGPASTPYPLFQWYPQRREIILYIKANMESVCLSVVTNRARQGRAARADTRPQQVIFSYA